MARGCFPPKLLPHSLGAQTGPNAPQAPQTKCSARICVLLFTLDKIPYCVCNANGKGNMGNTVTGHGMQASMAGRLPVMETSGSGRPSSAFQTSEKTLRGPEQGFAALSRAAARQLGRYLVDPPRVPVGREPALSATPVSRGLCQAAKSRVNSDLESIPPPCEGGSRDQTARNHSQHWVPPSGQGPRQGSRDFQVGSTLHPHWANQRRKPCLMADTALYEMFKSLLLLPS